MSALKEGFYVAQKCPCVAQRLSYTVQKYPYIASPLVLHRAEVPLHRATLVLPRAEVPLHRARALVHRVAGPLTGERKDPRGGGVVAHNCPMIHRDEKAVPHARQAFEFGGSDHCGKPVDSQRLEIVLAPKERQLPKRQFAAADRFLTIDTDGKVNRVGAAEIWCIKAQKHDSVVRITAEVISRSADGASAFLGEFGRFNTKSA